MKPMLMKGDPCGGYIDKFSLAALLLKQKMGDFGECDSQDAVVAWIEENLPPEQVPAALTGWAMGFNTLLGQTAELVLQRREFDWWNVADTALTISARCGPGPADPGIHERILYLAQIFVAGRTLLPSALTEVDREEWHHHQVPALLKRWWAAEQLPTPDEVASHLNRLHKSA